MGCIHYSSRCIGLFCRIYHPNLHTLIAIGRFCPGSGVDGQRYTAITFGLTELQNVASHGLDLIPQAKVEESHAKVACKKGEKY